MGKFKIFALALALCANSLFADRVVTDQIGRDVTLPDELMRFICNYCKSAVWILSF